MAQRSSTGGGGEVLGRTGTGLVGRGEGMHTFSYTRTFVSNLLNLYGLSHGPSTVPHMLRNVTDPQKSLQFLCDHTPVSGPGLPEDEVRAEQR